MKLAHCLLLIAVVFSLPVRAASRIDWEYPLTDKTVATFELVGKPDYCFIATPAATFTIVSHDQTYTGSICQQSTVANEFFGHFPKGADGEMAAFFIDLGVAYTNLMKQWEQSGGAGGDIGNAINGKCVDSADAFLSLPGPSLGDPDANIIGYCMNPKVYQK